VSKNFDEMLPSDREFTVGGETFHWKDVRPEVLTSFDTDENPGAPVEEVWKVIDARVLQFLPEDEHERWRTLRARDENPVTIQQLNAIVTWFIEEQTGRPTEAPSPSASGRTQTKATSKAA
jgi:hypothetical protein